MLCEFRVLDSCRGRESAITLGLVGDALFDELIRGQRPSREVPYWL